MVSDFFLSVFFSRFLRPHPVLSFPVRELKKCVPWGCFRFFGGYFLPIPTFRGNANEVEEVRLSPGDINDLGEKRHYFREKRNPSQDFLGRRRLPETPEKGQFTF